MPNECDRCEEYLLDCKCNDDVRIRFAMSALKFALTTLSILGYELKSKIEFKKIPLEAKKKYPDNEEFVVDRIEI